MFWLIKHIAAPLAGYVTYNKEFQELAADCAMAMDNTWYLKQEEYGDLNSNIVELLVCHDYDKTRKKMLVLGVPESALSYLGLKALEQDQIPARMMVRSHEFRER